MAGKVLNTRVLFYVALAFMFVNPQGAGAQEEKFQMRPGIRYTTGSYRIEGWQNQLVQGDHNLAHWNWCAITGYRQSMILPKTTAKQAIAAAPEAHPRSVYIKPIHIPTIVPRRDFTPRNDSRTPSDDPEALVFEGPERLTHAALNGRITPKKAPTGGASSQPLVMTYGGPARSSTDVASGALANKAVHGTIINKTGI